MNIIIPILGLGERFSREGYNNPKPLINILGRPMLYWLIDNLNLKSDDIIWIALPQRIITHYELEYKFSAEYPNLDLRIISSNLQTRGAAETLYLIIKQMNDDERKRKTISLDCDTLYFSDILDKFRQVEYNCCFYFNELNELAIFSFIKFEKENNLITDIAEKVRISSFANTGGYGFISANLLSYYCELILDKSVDSTGEYYTSSVIKNMINDDQKFIAIYVDQFNCVGTPPQIKEFIKQLRSSNLYNYYSPKKKLRLCFDLDGTLVTHPKILNDYSSVSPINRNIELLRNFHSLGHTIIIHTARRMKTHKSNLGKVIKIIPTNFFC